MATVFTCKTPEDGWALYNHFLGNGLLAISLDCDNPEETAGEAEEQKKKRQQDAEDAWLRLLGALNMIADRMWQNRLYETVGKMEQILVMVRRENLFNPDVRKAIHAKYKELDKGIGQFEAAVQEIRREGTAKRR